ncbi:MAG: hypothetical protein ACTSYA_04055 [Candidatus Kariarchaeaceae archaeon]
MILEMLPIISMVFIGLLGVNILHKFGWKYENTLDKILSGSILSIFFLTAPMVLLNRLFNVPLDTICYFYFSVSMLYPVYLLFKHYQQSINSLTFFELKIPPYLKDIRVIISGLILLSYTIITILYPFRGWDALHFYLPHARVFYFTNDIPIISPYNFLPIFKPPLNSLLYTYALYVTKEDSFVFFSIVILFLTVLTVYRLAFELFQSKRKAISSVLFFITSPLTWFLVYEWAYYQDLYVMAFYTMAFYFHLRLIQGKESTKQNATIAGLSLALAGLSKISGFALPLLIFISAPSNKIGKALRLSVLTVMTLFLARKAGYDIYIGVGIVILLFGLYLAYLIVTQQETKNLSLTTLALEIFPWLAVAVYWLYDRIKNTPGTRDFLTDLYVYVNDKSWNYSFPEINIPEAETYIENAMKASFGSAVLVIFIGSIFALPWALPKIFGIFKREKDEGAWDMIRIWLIGFYIIWLAYFSFTSTRYLSVILVPLALLTVKGFYFLHEKLTEGREPSLLVEGLLLLLAFGSQYPFYPLETVSLEFHLRYYEYHRNLFRLGYYFVAFVLLLYLIIKWDNYEFSLKKPRKSSAIRKGATVGVISVLIIAPIGGQIILLYDTGFDIDDFHNKWVYDARENMMDLIEAIRTSQTPNSDIIIGANVPGLEFYSSHPVIDLFYTTEFDLSKNQLGRFNTTSLLELMDEYDITLIVSLRKDHNWYESFESYILREYPLFSMVHNSDIFSYLYNNSEFELYKVNNLNSFYGAIDLGLSIDDSILGISSLLVPQIERETSTGELMSLLDFTSLQASSVVISSQIFYSVGEEVYQQTYSLNSSDLNSFIKFKMMNLPYTSFQLINASLTYTWINQYYQTLQKEEFYAINPLSSGLITFEQNIWSVSDNCWMIIE